MLFSFCSVHITLHCGFDSGYLIRGSGKCTRLWLLAGPRKASHQASLLCMNVSCGHLSLLLLHSKGTAYKDSNCLLTAGGFVQTLLGTHIWMSMQLLGKEVLDHTQQCMAPAAATA